MTWKRLALWSRASYRSDQPAVELEPLAHLQPLPSNCARLYLANGSIEFICLACLEPVCVVRRAHHASALLASHVCHHEQAEHSALAASV